MNCQSLFSGENEKNIINLLSVKLAHREENNVGVIMKGSVQS